MSLRSNVFRALVSFLLVICFSVGGFADTIRLKDGSRVKGKIVSFTGGKFVVAVGEGSRRREMTLLAGDVDSIEFDTPRSPATNVMASNRNTTPPVSRDNVRVADSKPSNQSADNGRVADNKPVKPSTDNRAVNTKPAEPDASQPIEEEEEVVSVPSSTPASTPPPSNNKKVSFAKPVELSVKVLADNTANGWTNSGWVVKKGQRIRISGSGEVSIGKGKKTGPSGLYDLEDKDKLLKSVPTGALLAVIGDDNNEFIYIGAEREFTAARDGALFLGLNEGNLNDNTGSFEVKIEITPDGGE